MKLTKKLQEAANAQRERLLSGEISESDFKYFMDALIGLQDDLNRLKEGYDEEE